MHTWQALWTLLLLPLAGSALSALLHFAALSARKRSVGAADSARSLAPFVACAAVGASFGLSILAFLKLGGLEADAWLESSSWSWIDAGSLSIDLSLVVDRLSAVLLLVVTGVGFLIHVYSIGYMKDDPGSAKFFAYMNLFVFAMLVLVLSSSLIGLFVGWEGVGLCSYLLIGFWYAKGWPAEAGQKAFVMNRIGDACFLIGSFLIAGTFGTLDLSEIGAQVPSKLAEHAPLWIAALLLFGGACGKSAQFPLLTWLPDAMAGPTPVSALIHAATMVTAGVYLIVRLNPLYAASPGVLAFIGCIGAATAFIGATSALFQRDIKKVLAYSTISQLGYMFLGLSTGAWVAAIFHLVTHAFFKGLLFLGAGSVIHGMHGEQDMARMGGLRKFMPHTFATFLAGAAALSGLPLLSGFVSKDEILAHAFAGGGLHLLLWLVGLGSAALTAFYTWRMVALTFFGPERFDHERVHPHESPAVMTVPLSILAVLSVFGGVLGLPAVFGVTHALERWLEPALASGNALLATAHGAGVAPLSHALEWTLLGVGAAVALLFAHAGFHAYARGPEADARLAERGPQASRLFARAWGIDEAYTQKIVRPLLLACFLVASVIDQIVIDGAVNGAAALATRTAGRLRALVDGSVKSYALWMGAGAGLLVVVWICC